MSQRDRPDTYLRLAFYTNRNIHSIMIADCGCTFSISIHMKEKEKKGVKSPSLLPELPRIDLHTAKQGRKVTSHPKKIKKRWPINDSALTSATALSRDVQ